MNDTCALAFYVQYPDGVKAILFDLFDEFNATKEGFKENARKKGGSPDLIDLAVENWPTFLRLHDDLERERKTFEKSLYGILKRCFNAAGHDRNEAYVSFARHIKPNWGLRQRITLPDGVKDSYHGIKVGWYFRTVGSKVRLQPWIRAGKGRPAGEKLRELIDKWQDCLTLTNGEDGAVILMDIACEGYLLDSKAELDTKQLDTKRLLADFERGFSWVDRERIKQILTMRPKIVI